MTLTEYLDQVKSRLEKANPDGCQMSRATHFSYDFADNCMDDLSKLIRIVEIQSEIIDKAMELDTPFEFVNGEHIARRHQAMAAFLQIAIRDANKIASER